MTVRSQLLECVPNFSVGSDYDTLRAIEASFRSVSGVSVLSVHADSAHNRSVFTVIGEPLALQEAAFEAVRTALERIDLRKHRGQHPRIGAADVIPFVSIPPTPKTLAVLTAREFAECTAHALDLPIGQRNVCSQGRHDIDQAIAKMVVRHARKLAGLAVIPSKVGRDRQHSIAMPELAESVAERRL